MTSVPILLEERWCWLCYRRFAYPIGQPHDELCACRATRERDGLRWDDMADFQKRDAMRSGR